MVLFLAVLLCVSALGLICLIAVKHWELTTGRVLFSELRPAAARVLGAGLHFVERRAPAALKNLARRFYAEARETLHLAVAWVALRTERLLERLLNTLRHTTHVRGDGQASAFLREVAEHKKSLQERQERNGKKPNAIYEE